MTHMKNAKDNSNGPPVGHSPAATCSPVEAADRMLRAVDAATDLQTARRRANKGLAATFRLTCVENETREFKEALHILLSDADIYHGKPIFRDAALNWARTLQEHAFAANAPAQGMATPQKT